MKKRLIILTVILMAMSGVFLGGGSKLNWGGSLVIDGIEKGLASFDGVSLVNSSVTGNPLTGYQLGPMRFLDGNGVTVAAVRSLRLRLNLMALFKRKIALSSVVLNGIRVEEFLLSEIPLAENGSSSAPIKVDRIEVVDVAPLYGGDWAIKNARLRYDEQLWNADIEGTWREEKLSGESVISLGDGKATLKSMNLSLAGGKITCQGKVYPGLALSGDVSGVRFENLSHLYPALAEASLRGSLSADYNIDGRLADPVASGELEVTDGGVIDIVLNRIAGEWAYSGEKLSLNGLNGLAFGAPVSGDMSIDFKDTESLYSLSFSGRKLDSEAWTAAFSWLDFMKDTRLDDIKVDLSGPIDSLSGIFDFSGASGDVYGFNLAKISGRASLKELEKVDLNLKGKWLGSDIICSGPLDLDKGLAKLEIGASQVHLNRLVEQWPDVKDLKLEGNAHAKIALSGPFDDLSLAGDLRSDRFRSDGILFEKGSAKFKYDGKDISLKGFQARLKKAIIRGSGAIKYGQAGYSFNLSGSADSLDGSSLKELVPALGAMSLGGSVGVKWRYEGQAEKGDLSLDLSSKSLSVYEIFPIKNFKGKLTVRDGSVVIEDMKGSLFGGAVSMSGRVKYTGKSDVNLTGNLKSIKAATLLKALGSPEAEGMINGSFKVSGPASAPVLYLKTEAGSLKMDGVELKPISMTFSSSGNRLKVDIKGKLAGSPLKGGGWIQFPSGKKAGELDLVATTDGLDVGSVLPPDIRAGGNVSLKLHLLGKMGKTKLYIEGKAPRLQFGNAAFSKVEVGGYAGREKGISFSASSQFGDKRVNASCDLIPEGKEWTLNFEASGKGISIGDLEPAIASAVKGRVDLNMKGSLKKKGLAASGKLLGKEIEARGLKFTEVSLPLVVSGSSVSIAGGTGSFYGGAAALDFKADLSKNQWSGKANVKDFDIEPVIKAGANLAGRITGKGDLRMNLNGISGRAFLMNITGYFRGKSMELRDFSVISEVTKGQPLRIKDLAANFNVDGREFFLLPGSRASAWPDDKIYRYFDVSGSVWNSSANEAKRASPLDLNCSGEVNLRAFNVFLGALHNLLKASIDTLRDPKALATDLLSGIVGGYSSTEFREIRLHVGGHWSSPAISKLKVSDKQGYSAPSFSDPSSVGGGTGNDTKIQIKIDIPTGEGSGSGVEAGDQVKKQLMENLLKQVIGGDSDEDK